MDQLKELHDVIVAFASSNSTNIDIATLADRSPAPYDQSLAGIKIRKNEGLIHFSVDDEILVLSGSVERIMLFAENLPYDIDRDTEHYHCHFDRVGHESDFAANSLDTVLMMKNIPS
ncbi:hypothetical protein OT109_08490 [Phycisphaeraceae bacterium D3-23]